MIDIKYEDSIEGGSQYADDKGIVNAKYVRSESAFGKGNALIEALPPRLSDDEMRYNYEVGIPGYNSAEVSKMTKHQRLARINDIKYMRMIMPFSTLLDNAFHQALVDANINRELVCDEFKGLMVRVHDKDVETGIVRVNSSDGTGPSFGLIGISGSGKSSAVNLMLSRYPQVIRHIADNGCDFYQITYVFVNCLPNSNFSALYESIGEEIDKSLGNVVPFYRDEVRKARNLGSKLKVVSALVTRFAISAIIFDEIQEIDFSTSKENSFEALMILNNETKVSIVAVGTEEARDKLYVKPRTRRRFGKVIRSDEKCNDIMFFKYMLHRVFYYQYFYEKVNLDDEIVQGFYEATHGVISQIISLYIELHIDYFDKIDKVIAKMRRKNGKTGDFSIEEYKEAHKYMKFTADSIKKVAKKLYDKLTDMYDFSSDDIDAISRIEDIDTRIAVMKEHESMKHQQAEESRLIESKCVELIENQNMLSNIIINIQKCSDFTAKQIEDVYKKVVKKNSERDEVKLTKLIMMELQKPKRAQSRIIKDVNLDTVLKTAMDSSFNNKDENAGTSD